MVFTNGDISSRSRDHLASLPEDRVTVTVNLTNCSPLSSNVKKTLLALGCKGMAGVTIYRPDMKLEYLLEIIDEYGLSKSIRLGLAHPGSNATDGALSPQNYFSVGQNIKVFAQQAQQVGVRLILDCGFVPCMFGKEALSPFIWLCCGPIPDILPDGKIIHCFPCAEQDKYHVSDFNHLSEAKNKLTELLAPYREVGIFKSCSECFFRAENKCLGGCRGTAMRRLSSVGFTIKKELYKNMKPTQTQALETSLKKKNQRPVSYYLSLASWCFILIG
jgi:hypothetical protein